MGQNGGGCECAQGYRVIDFYVRGAHLNPLETVILRCAAPRLLHTLRSGYPGTTVYLER